MDIGDVISVPPPNIDRGRGLLAEEITLTSLALITTIFRIGVRLAKKQARWDDLTITIAMILRLLSFSFTMVSIAYGNGRHEYYLSDHQIQEIMKYTWANEVLIFTTTCIIKISICLYILRIKNTRVLRWFLYGVMLGLVVTNLVCIIVLFAQCQPLSAFWDREAGTCWNGNIYNYCIYVAVGYSVLSDLLCTVMPIIMLWTVRITSKQKYGMCGLMFLGLVASGCAAVRAYLSALAEGTDLTIELITTDEWGFAEANVGIIGANLALSQMVYYYFKRKFSKADPFEQEKKRKSGPIWPAFHNNRASIQPIPDDVSSIHSKDLDADAETESETRPPRITSRRISPPSYNGALWPSNLNVYRYSNTFVQPPEGFAAGLPYNQIRPQAGPVGALPPLPDQYHPPGTAL